MKKQNKTIWIVGAVIVALLLVNSNMFLIFASTSDTEATCRAQKTTKEANNFDCSAKPCVQSISTGSWLLWCGCKEGYKYEGGTCILEGLKSEYLKFDYTCSDTKENVVLIHKIPVNWRNTKISEYTCRSGICLGGIPQYLDNQLSSEEIETRMCKPYSNEDQLCFYDGVILKLQVSDKYNPTINLDNKIAIKVIVNGKDYGEILTMGTGSAQRNSVVLVPGSKVKLIYAYWEDGFENEGYINEYITRTHTFTAPCVSSTSNVAKNLDPNELHKLIPKEPTAKVKVQMDEEGVSPFWIKVQNWWSGLFG